MTTTAASLKWTVLGSLAAIAITTWMDASGLGAFSALALCPLLFLFWYLERLSRRAVGFAWGKPRDYLMAVTYPIVVIGAASLVSFLSGAVDLSGTNWNHFWLNLIAGGLSTVVAAIITEEGFFRGWLWASIEKAGGSSTAALLSSSVVFSLWHLSAVVLPTGFDLPAAQVPIFMANATLLGLVWGLLRLGSGSVIVASVSHGVWNGLAYSLFAFGTKVGALGVTTTWVFGPETGLVGLALNGGFAAALWRWTKSRR